MNILEISCAADGLSMQDTDLGEGGILSDGYIICKDGQTWYFSSAPRLTECPIHDFHLKLLRCFLRRDYDDVLGLIPRIDLDLLFGDLMSIFH